MNKDKVFINRSRKEGVLANKLFRRELRHIQDDNYVHFQQTNTLNMSLCVFFVENHAGKNIEVKV